MLCIGTQSWVSTSVISDAVVDGLGKNELEWVFRSYRVSDFSLFHFLTNVFWDISVWRYELSKCSFKSQTCLTTGWTTGRSVFDPRQGQRIFLLASVSRPALGPTQAPVQWVPGVLSPGVKRGRGVMLTTHPHLVPRSWMSRSYISPPKRLNGV
jgi:hypothetical protein